MSTKPIVLFLCARNAARSQMAEGLLRDAAGDRFEVHSAGVEPGELHPLAVRVMAEIGIDISRQQAKAAKPLLGRLPARHIVVVCADDDAPTAWPNILSKEVWPLEDPVAFEGTEEEKLNRFRAVRDGLRDRVRRWLSHRHR